jgi:hypothetical protein
MKIKNQNYSKLSYQLQKFSRSPMIKKRSKIIISCLIFPLKKNAFFKQMTSENHFGVKATTACGG